MLRTCNFTSQCMFRLGEVKHALPRELPGKSGNTLALSHTSQPIGALAYMAPEQLHGARVSAASDAYVFGLILFEMVSGKRAFPSNKFLSRIAQRLKGPSPDSKTHIPSLPEPWCHAIVGCLRSNTDERFVSAPDAVAALEGERAQLPRPLHRKASSAPLPKRTMWMD